MRRGRKVIHETERREEAMAADINIELPTRCCQGCESRCMTTRRLAKTTRAPNRQCHVPNIGRDRPFASIALRATRTIKYLCKKMYIGGGTDEVFARIRKGEGILKKCFFNFLCAYMLMGDGQRRMTYTISLAPESNELADLRKRVRT